MQVVVQHKGRKRNIQKRTGHAMRSGFPLMVLVGMLALFCGATPAHAWGRQGHTEVARFAELHLSPQALDQVHRLLRNDLDALGQPSGRRNLASIASWADEIREVAPEGAFKGWHSRSNPVCSHALARCKNGHCVDELIEHFSQILQDREQSERQRNEALKWIVHLIGDLHQPLHSGVAKDGGHTAVTAIQGRALNPGTTLHNVWDSDLAKLALRHWHAHADPGDLPEKAPVSPRQWMLESRDLALDHVYRPLPGFTCDGSMPSEVSLDEAYVEQAIPVIRQQIERAGLRLAQRLNQLLP